MATFTGLPPDYFKFFKELRENNNREWFNDNKPRFRASVQEPLATLVEAMAPRLKKISKYFVADPRLNGGSVFRIYKDVRFSKDKAPYKMPMRRVFMCISTLTRFFMAAESGRRRHRNC